MTNPIFIPSIDTGLKFFLINGYSFFSSLEFSDNRDLLNLSFCPSAKVSLLSDYLFQPFLLPLDRENPLIRVLLKSTSLDDSIASI